MYERESNCINPKRAIHIFFCVASHSSRPPVQRCRGMQPLPEHGTVDHDSDREVLVRVLCRASWRILMKPARMAECAIDEAAASL